MKRITSIYRLLDEVKAAVEPAQDDRDKYISVQVELRAGEPNPKYTAWVPSLSNYVTAGSPSELVELTKGAIAGLVNDMSLEDDRAPDFKEQELFPDEETK